VSMRIYRKAVPTVTFRRNYQTRSAGVKDWVLVRPRSGDETMDVNFCLMPSRVQHHNPHRPEMLTA